MNDLHAHLYTPEWYPTRFQEAIAIDFLKRRNTKVTPDSISKTMLQMNKLLTDRDGSKTLKIMDNVGIEKKVILILDFGFELGEAEKSIEQIHEDILGICNKYPDRLIGFAGVDPRRHNASEILEHAITKLNAKGFKMHPTGGWGLLDDITIKLISIVHKNKLPVLSHIGKTVEMLDDANAQPEPFIELAKRFPNSQFIAGHSGFSLWKKFVSLKDQIPDNLCFDISGWQELIIKDGSNIIEDIGIFKKAFPGKICFGTDSPFYGYNMPFAEKKWYDLVSKVKTSEWPEIIINDNLIKIK